MIAATRPPSRVEALTTLQKIHYDQFQEAFPDPTTSMNLYVVYLPLRLADSCERYYQIIHQAFRWVIDVDTVTEDQVVKDLAELRRIAASSVSESTEAQSYIVGFRGWCEERAAKSWFDDDMYERFDRLFCR